MNFYMRMKRNCPLESIGIIIDVFSCINILPYLCDHKTNGQADVERMLYEHRPRYQIYSHLSCFSLLLRTVSYLLTEQSPS
jgi:hypothetical protein